MSADLDLRLGRWQDALADVERVDCVITDPPYSDRTHAAQRHDAVAVSKSFRALEYSSFSERDARAFVEHWEPRTSGWFVVFSDHELQRVYEESLRERGRYTFAPLPQTTIGRSVRLCGDGPATWTTWITVARPRNSAFAHWGALPGAYVDNVGDRRPGLVHGAKQLELMRAIVRDYSRPGDIVCDPCAGGATTLIAAALEGRRAIGSEMDPVTYEKARIRIERGNAGLRSPNQIDLFGGDPER